MSPNLEPMRNPMLWILAVCLTMSFAIVWYKKSQVNEHISIVHGDPTRRTIFHLFTDKPKAPNVFVSQYREYNGLQEAKYKLSFLAHGEVKPGTLNCTVTRDWKTLIPINIPVDGEGSNGESMFSAEFVPEGDTISVYFILEDVGEAWITNLEIEKVQ